MMNPFEFGKFLRRIAEMKILHLEDSDYRVDSPSGKSYLVSPTKCDCPSGRFRSGVQNRHCVHVMAVNIFHEMIQDDSISDYTVTRNKGSLSNEHVKVLDMRGGFYIGLK